MLNKKTPRTSQFDCLTTNLLSERTYCVAVKTFLLHVSFVWYYVLNYGFEASAHFLHLSDVKKWIVRGKWKSKFSCIVCWLRIEAQKPHTLVKLTNGVQYLVRSCSRLGKWHLQPISCLASMDAFKNNNQTMLPVICHQKFVISHQGRIYWENFERHI